MGTNKKVKLAKFARLRHQAERYSMFKMLPKLGFNYIWLGTDGKDRRLLPKNEAIEVMHAINMSIKKPKKRDFDQCFADIFLAANKHVLRLKDLEGKQFWEFVCLEVPWTQRVYPDTIFHLITKLLEGHEQYLGSSTLEHIAGRRHLYGKTFQAILFFKSSEQNLVPVLNPLNEAFSLATSLDPLQDEPQPWGLSDGESDDDLFGYGRGDDDDDEDEDDDDDDEEEDIHDGEDAGAMLSAVAAQQQFDGSHAAKRAGKSEMKQLFELGIATIDPAEHDEDGGFGIGLDLDKEWELMGKTPRGHGKRQPPPPPRQPQREEELTSNLAVMEIDD